MENFSYFIFCVIALIIGILIIKKVAGCLIRTTLFVAVIIALAIIYYLYFRP